MEQNKQSCPCATGECARTRELSPCMPRPTKLLLTPAVLEDWEEQKLIKLSELRDYIQSLWCPQATIRRNFWAKRYEELWVELNPAPNLTLRQAYNQSVTRIATLETALAEKGGAR